MKALRLLGHAALTLLLLVVLVLAVFRLWASWRETIDESHLAPRDGLRLETPAGRFFAQGRGKAEAPPVLIVHGTAAWSGFWTEALDTLAGQGFRAVALDLPPFGFSARDPEHRYSRADQARRIAAAARAVTNGRKPVLIGHSFGAGPALEAALREPDAFAGLVIVSGALALGPGEDLPPEPSPLLRALIGQRWITEPLIAATATNPLATRYLLSTMLYRTAEATPEIAEILQRPQWLPGTTAAYARWLPNLLFPDTAALGMKPANIRALKLPLAVIWGRQDTVTPLDQGQRLAGLVPNATFDAFDLVGHIPHLEAPEMFHPALLTRLRDMHGLPLQF